MAAKRAFRANLRIGVPELTMAQTITPPESEVEAHQPDRLADAARKTCDNGEPLHVPFGVAPPASWMAMEISTLRLATTAQGAGASSPKMAQAVKTPQKHAFALPQAPKSQTIATQAREQGRAGG